MGSVGSSASYIMSSDLHEAAVIRRAKVTLLNLTRNVDNAITT
jgi:hypothetical protein